LDDAFLVFVEARPRVSFCSTLVVFALGSQAIWLEFHPDLNHRKKENIVCEDSGRAQRLHLLIHSLSPASLSTDQTSLSR
jgi:hypothetical protein